MHKTFNKLSYEILKKTEEFKIILDIIYLLVIRLSSVRTFFN